MLEEERLGSGVVAVKGVVVAVVDDVSAASALSVDVVAELAVVASIWESKDSLMAGSVELSCAAALSKDSLIASSVATAASAVVERSLLESSAVNALLSWSRSA